MNILDKAVEALLKKPTAKEPAYIMHDSCFMDSTIYFYQSGKFYEGKKKIVMEVVSCRSKGVPSKEQVNLVTTKLKENNKGIIFNIEVGHYYGSWVVRGEKITSKKIADKELLEMMIETRIELGHLVCNF